MITEQTPIVKESAGQFKLNWRDAGLGLVVAVITAALTAILDTINSGVTNINWKTVGIVAATAGISYLLKNFFTPAKTIVMAPKEEVKITDTTTGKTLTPEKK